jgi:uncharacterized protein (DUF427 family)
MQAKWQGAILADSDDTIVVEGNHYFPAASLDQRYFRPSEHTTRCGWKGTANYYDVVVGDAVNANAAWVYRAPLEAAGQIRGYVAFWHGVEVVDGGGLAGG